MAEERSQTPTSKNPNPSSIINTTNQAKKKTTTKKKYEYEYCVVCKLNHDQGPNHKYMPSHTKTLTAFLSRFQTKLSDLRFYLKNPCRLRREDASRNRLWCVFCDSDIDELDSSFACDNAIHHLASAEHLKNLKHFLWKCGGGMDRVDTFRVLEADLTTWEKRCKKLKSEAVANGGGSQRPKIGPSNDIQNDFKCGIIDTLENKSSSSFPNGVMPLLYHTNEYQVSHSGVPQVANYGCFPQDVATSFFHQDSGSGTYSVNSKRLAVYDSVSRSTQHSFISNGRNCSFDGHGITEMISKVHQHDRMAKGEISYQGFQSLTQISSTGPQEASGNVHSGAPPPWLEADEQNQFSVKPFSSTLLSPSNKSGKSKKLNPKRVGAAWAERRKRELEMEKRGELVKSDCDANWLPNFGRVWQSGTRKESRKEFELEKRKIPKIESQPEMPIQIHPYVSKRKRTDARE